MEPILKLEQIKKQYGGVNALNGIDLSFWGGQVHCIVGENGAGKSTLIKIITGAVKPSGGRLVLLGKQMKQNSPAKSMGMGVRAVYQELNMIPSLMVYENIYYGQELKKGISLDKKVMAENARVLLKSLGMEMDPQKKLRELGVGSRQIIEIAKALVQNAKVILFDEPTASLTGEEIDKLHEIIARLKKEGIAVIYVSHKLNEIFKIADTITVLRDGKLISSSDLQTANPPLTQDRIVHEMIGKDSMQKNQKAGHKMKEDDIVLELKHINTKHITNVNLKLYGGEILSISGVLGSGRSEVLNAIFGLDQIHQGEIYIKGKKAKIKSPADAIGYKIGYVTEDRKDTGLFIELPLRENMSMVFLRKFTNFFGIDKKKEAKSINGILTELQVKYKDLKQKSKELSGGNQQKIAIGKWLVDDLDIFMLDEPTRGVDIGAKEEVYKIIYQLAEQGKSILIVSSEGEEVIRLSDRTLVMSQGRVVSAYKKGEITSEVIFRDSMKLIHEAGDSNE